jgi:Glycosyl hydrolase family 76
MARPRGNLVGSDRQFASESARIRRFCARGVRRRSLSSSARLATALFALALCCAWSACADAGADLLPAHGHGVHARYSARTRSARALAHPALSAAQTSDLQIAEQGVARAQQLWRNGRLGWYDSHLGDRDRYPLATIWDATPLFEALSAIEIAAPSSAHRAAVTAFARGAERYFDATLHPIAGFAPYPGDRGQTRVWFDDNGWWGLAFLDAYRATGAVRYLHDAQRAFAFIAAEGWNRAGGGVWWNTSHPYLAGEPLAAGSLLGAQLLKLTGKPFYREQVLKFLDWAETAFLTERGLYKRTDSDPTPTPYIEGTLVEAQQVLCETGVSAACARAAQLADASAQRFEDRLTMGPQFDTIYLHWMLVYGAQTGDTRWRALAEEMVASAQAHARDARGLYLRAWDGTPITAHQAQPNMLQTDAATLELFAWLAAAG